MPNTRPISGGLSEDTLKEAYRIVSSTGQQARYVGLAHHEGVTVHVELPDGTRQTWANVGGLSTIVNE